MIKFKQIPKQFFLDRPKVQRAVKKGRLRALTRSGASVRLIAKRSIRKRKRKTSEPGKPPFSKTGFLRSMIFFAYDPSRDTVIVGPVGFNRSNVPEVLEHGGTSKVVNVRYRRGVKRRVATTANVKARPYMTPAMEETAKRMPDHWRNAIRG